MMTGSLNIKKDVPILKMLLWILCFGFEAMFHPSCYLTSIMDKTHHGSVIGLFSVQLQRSILATFEVAILVTNQFSLLLIDRYILGIQQIITHEEHLRYSF